ncbi:MAG TPA: hypothetical protein VNO50_15320 [Pyrinomonadaceae bacterium]|nr:hypothetical protein [Pyrinomonadaceae bacterium]
MRNLLLLLLISGSSVFVVPQQNRVSSSESSSLEVMEFKWTRRRQQAEKLEPGIPQPSAMVNPATRTYERSTRINQPRGERDPTADTLEARSAEIERNVQEARGPKPVDGFAYKVKVRNGSSKAADIVFWEYQFNDPTNPGTPTRRQFLCAVKIDPDKTKDIQAFSLLAPGILNAAGGPNNSSTSPLEKAVINRVEYVDGTIWRRKDWNFGEIRQNYLRAVAAPWGKEMCRVL